MKGYTLLVIMLVFVFTGFSQKRYFTKNANISFHAGTAMEDIDAINNSAISVFDAVTGQIEYAVLIKGFEFNRVLMQDHFNENYMESDKFPKSVFKGKITNIDQLNTEKDGLYQVKVKGLLEIHGVKKEVEVPGLMKVTGAEISTSADFSVLLSDYNITIASLVKDKISKTATITVNCQYTALK